MASIFISYRIADTLKEANQLYRVLSQVFDSNTVFFDKGRLEAGDKWPEELERNLRGAQIVLVLLNEPQKWLGVDKYGERRIDETEDWVRKEVELALSLGNQITTIPILFNNDAMPPKKYLPATIRDLCDRQALKIEGNNWTELLDSVKLLLNRKLNDIADEGIGFNNDWFSFFKKNPLKSPREIAKFNCNRNKAYHEGLERYFRENESKESNLLFFITACPFQKPSSLAKRLVYDISHRRNIAYSKEDNDVEVIDFIAGWDASETFYNTWNVKT